MRTTGDIPVLGIMQGRRDYWRFVRYGEIGMHSHAGAWERETITRQAMSKWSLVDVMLTHRTGRVIPDDPIVVVAVWSEHRAAAFDACRFIMEELKLNAPFWKKEVLAKGERWVGA